MKTRLPLCIGFALVMLLAGCRARPAAPTAAPTDRPTRVATLTLTVAPSATPLPPSATSTPLPSATPTVTQTPTITPTPSPTPQPAQRFADGLRQQRNGQYAQAAHAFQSIMSDPSIAALHGDALYRLGQTQGQAGDFVAVEKSLTQFLAGYPDHAQRDHARFLLGAAQEKLGKLEAAAASFEQYDAAHPELRGYVQKRIGDVYLALNQSERAISAYRRAADAAPWTAQRAECQEAIAAALTVAEKFTDAIAEYDSILGIARVADYRSRLQYEAGMTYLAAGQQDAAIQRFRRAIAEGERTSFAHTALVQLVELGAEVDEFQRGMVDYWADAYWPAIAAFERYLQTPTPARADAAQFYLAASYASLGMPAQAIPAYQKVLETYPNSDLFADAWLGRARQLGRAGDVEGARLAYQEFARRYPTHAQAPRALYTRARLREDAGQLDGAIQEYRVMADAYPQNSLAATARERAGLLLLRQSQFKDAGAVWDALAAGAPNETLREEALFWAGKSRLAAGDSAGAADPLRRAAVGRPLSFYGQRAAALLSAPPVNTPLYGISQTEAEAWLLGWTGVSAATLQKDIPNAIATHAKWVRGRELTEIGLLAEANDELDSLCAEYTDQPATLYYLAVQFAARNESDESIYCAERLMTLSGATWEATPAFVRRLVFPTAYYGDLVETEAQARGLDPLLVYALMRQESLFQGEALSYVAAQGLMQIMPDTGKWIAMRLGWTSYQTADLYLPYVNVKFGTYYLQQQLVGFDQDVTSALIAYNAGPGNAAAWRKEAAADIPDLLFALTDIEETRLYLQTVWYNYAAYRRLYPTR